MPKRGTKGKRSHRKNYLARGKERPKTTPKTKKPGSRSKVKRGRII